MDTPSKTCAKCFQKLPESEFYFRKDTGKLRNECKTCLIANHRERKTGWKPAEYLAAFERQQGRCCICKRHADNFKNGLVADHNHATEETRALLCGPCNTGLGLFQDDPKRLQGAIAYLTYHADQTRSNQPGSRGPGPVPRDNSRR